MLISEKLYFFLNLGLNFDKSFYLKAFLGVIRCGEFEKTGFVFEFGYLFSKKTYKIAKFGTLKCRISISFNPNELKL